MFKHIRLSLRQSLLFYKCLLHQLLNISPGFMANHWPSTFQETMMHYFSVSEPKDPIFTASHNNPPKTWFDRTNTGWTEVAAA